MAVAHGLGGSERLHVHASAHQEGQGALMAKPAARASAPTIHAPPRTWEQTHRPSARALPTPNITHSELAVLRAKAEVCDRYRRWLRSTSKFDRLRVCEALDKLARLEDAVANNQGCT